MKIPVVYEQEPFTNRVIFKRQRSSQEKLVAYIKFDGLRLSITGDYYDDNGRYSGGGQNHDDLLKHFADIPNAIRLRELWRRYHLNDMNAGDAEQEAFIRRLTDYGWKYDYDRASGLLEAAGLNPHDGYKYGHGWKFELVPEKIINELRSMKWKQLSEN